MASSLLTLPLEIHRKIFGLLNFPDLIRMRMTSQQLRQIAADDIIRDALLTLEDDWAEATIIRSHDKDTEEDMYESAKDVLVTWGYRSEEVKKLECRLPCCTCLRLQKSKRQFFSGTLEGVAYSAAAIAKSYQQYSNTLPTRKCIECFLQSTEYLETVGGRWLCAESSYYGHRWVAKCRSCDKDVSLDKAPAERQRRADLCTQCYRESHKEWFGFADKMTQEMDSMQQRINIIYAEQAKLRNYVSWMEDVDDGRSVAGHRPKDLETFEMPDWEKVRADALEEVPKVKKFTRPIQQR